MKRSNKSRYVNTRFWNDTLISRFEPLEKYVFLYFLTNAHANISGIYELPTPIIVVETKIDEPYLEKILPVMAEKIRHIKNYVVIKNFIKYQKTENESIQKGILNCLREIPFSFLKDVLENGQYILPENLAIELYKTHPDLEGLNEMQLREIAKGIRAVHERGTSGVGAVHERGTSGVGAVHERGTSGAREGYERSETEKNGLKSSVDERGTSGYPLPTNLNLNSNSNLNLKATGNFSTKKPEKEKKEIARHDSTASASLLDPPYFLIVKHASPGLEGLPYGMWGVRYRTLEEAESRFKELSLNSEVWDIKHVG